VLPSLSFSELLKGLGPAPRNRDPAWQRVANGAMFVCPILALCVAALIWASEGDRAWLWLPVGLLVIGAIAMVVNVVTMVLEESKHIRNPGLSLAYMLDAALKAELVLAESLAGTPVHDLQNALTRLESELGERERWANVIKHFALLVPALLLIASSKMLGLEGAVSDFLKLVGASLIVGVSIGAITTSRAILQLRRLAATLRYSIDSREQASAAAVARKAKIRKVSRTRGLGRENPKQ
jgi:hypothetical protein